MGLDSGPKGAKHFVVHRYRHSTDPAFSRHFAPAVWQVYHAVADVPSTINHGTPRKNVSMGIDGNVAIMRTPKAAHTIREFSACFAAQVVKLARAAKYVVLLFDEPDHVPLAKVAEQRRRDAMSNKKKVVCSDDFGDRDSAAPADDNYDSARLERVSMGCSAFLL